MQKWAQIAVVTGFTFGVAPLWAEDRALIIGNENYADAADVTLARRAGRAAAALRDTGFSVLEGKDLKTVALLDLHSRLLHDLKSGDRVVILLAGHFAKSAGETWFLGIESSLPDLATVGANGINLDSVLEIAAQLPGDAVVLLGGQDRRLPLAKGLTPGVGDLDVPQGVTLVQGDADQVIEFAADALSRRGRSLAELAKSARGVTVSGYLPMQQAFRPESTQPVVAPTPVQPTETDVDKAQERLWGDARAAGNIAAYQTYLDRYPFGRFAALARAEITRLEDDPATRAEQAEAALGLDRDQRRTIQRQLSLLGFNPRGIDGLFGAGSRAAIAGWQKREGVAPTGYITRDQLTRLAAQADRRAAQLEAEAAARKAEQDRQDRIYWEQTGLAGDEAGLRAYLKRHPDGLFAEVAADRLAVFEEARRARAAEQDRAAWELAEAANSVDGYRRYLSEFGRGAFADEAKARISALQEEAEGGPNRARAEAAERALGLNALARRLIERRLSGLGFDPGPADGQFDKQTRRAIRRFQASRNQEATGFLDQAAVVALLAGGVIKLGE